MKISNAELARILEWGSSYENQQCGLSGEDQALMDRLDLQANERSASKAGAAEASEGKEE